MRQYETFELQFAGEVLTADYVVIPLGAEFTNIAGEHEWAAHAGEGRLPLVQRSAVLRRADAALAGGQALPCGADRRVEHDKNRPGRECPRGHKAPPARERGTGGAGNENRLRRTE